MQTQNEIEDFLQSIKPIKKKSYKLLYFILFLIVIGILFLGVKLTAGEFSDEIDTKYHTKHYFAQINGQDAIIWDNEDGTFNSRVQYTYCHEVAVLAGLVSHCDRRLVNIGFELR